MISLVIFDLDGTLIDSRADLATAMNRVLADFSFPLLPVDLITSFVGQGIRTLVSRAVQAAAQIPVSDAMVQRFHVHYAECLLNETTLYPGTCESLELLDFTSLALATNKPGRHARVILNALELSRFFPVVVAGDDGCVLKPAPDSLHRCAALSGHPSSQTLVVGDSVHDLAAAEAAGMRSCLASWGFAGLEPVKSHHPTVIAESILDIPRIVRTLCSE